VQEDHLPRLNSRRPTKATQIVLKSPRCNVVLSSHQPLLASNEPLLTGVSLEFRVEAIVQLTGVSLAFPVEAIVQLNGVSLAFLVEAIVQPLVAGPHHYSYCIPHLHPPHRNTKLGKTAGWLMWASQLDAARKTAGCLIWAAPFDALAKTAACLVRASPFDGEESQQPSLCSLCSRNLSLAREVAHRAELSKQHLQFAVRGLT
jgi:hypothetical protein